MTGEGGVSLCVCISVCMYVCLPSLSVHVYSMSVIYVPEYNRWGSKFKVQSPGHVFASQ